MNKTDRQAEDGSRVNDAGEKWYPPLGNGIKAAVDGLVPVKGATQTGEVVPHDSDEADEKFAKLAAAGPNGAVSDPAPDPSAAERIASETRADEAKKSDEETLVNGLQGAKISNGDAAGAGEVGGPAALDKDGSAAADVPAVETKAGEPVGEVAFDHPPSEGEIKAALKAAS